MPFDDEFDDEGILYTSESEHEQDPFLPQTTRPPLRGGADRRKGLVDKDPLPRSQAGFSSLWISDAVCLGSCARPFRSVACIVHFSPMLIITVILCCREGKSTETFLLSMILLVASAGLIFSGALHILRSSEFSHAPVHLNTDGSICFLVYFAVEL